VHCQVGLRGHVAARLLAQRGRDVANLDGGYLTWQAGAASQAGDQSGPGVRRTGFVSQLAHDRCQ